MSDNDKTKPDVNAIIAEICEDMKSVEPPEEIAESARSLYDELELAGRTFSGGYLPTGGLTAITRKIIYRMLGLKEFNGRIVRILCRIVALLEGTEVPESKLVLTRQKNTMDLLIEMSKRLTDYDKLRLETRLERLEQELENMQTAATKS
jgi:hypothetical protein